MTETIYSKSLANTIDSSSSRRVITLFLGLVILLFIIARLWQLTSSCLWFDEIFSIHAAEHSWSTLTHFVAADLVHPPLFYVLLKLWIGIGGESLLWLRLFPAIVSIAAIAPIVLLARELGLTRSETSLALLLLAVNGYLIKYAQEVRMYSLLFLLSACSLWLFVSVLQSRTQNSPWRIVALTAVNLLMVYTHYYGWLLVALQLIAILVMHRRLAKQFIIGSAILVLAYIPWLVQVARAYQSTRADQNIGWIPRPGVRALFESITMLNQPFIFPVSTADERVSFFLVGLVLLIFGVPIAVLIWQLSKRKWPQANSRSLILLIVFAFAPFVSAAALSWVLPKSIWGTRHLIIAIVPYSMLAATAIMRLREYWARVAVCLILACWFSTGAIYAVIKPMPNYIWCAWTPLAGQLMRVTAPQPDPVKVYAFEDLVAYHLWFALRNVRGADYRIAVMKGVPGTNEDAEYFLPRDFNDVSIRGPEVPNEDHFWIAFRGARLDANLPPLQQFSRAGYELRTVLTERMENQEAFLIELHRKKE